MQVNRELDHLAVFLEGLFEVLKLGGRALIISFHSLEDRLVKRFFKKHSVAPSMPRGLPLRESEISFQARLRTIGKAIKASSEEVLQNPRSRSAILRIAERVS